MFCMECGAGAQKGYTTDVTDFHTGDVVEHLEKIVESA